MRIAGVVVAIDDYYGRRVYTIDDGTGQCIECTVLAPREDTKSNINHRQNGEGKAVEPRTTSARNNIKAHDAETQTGTGATAITPGIPNDIEVGIVLDVKGSVSIFRGQKQIKMQKATPMRSTNEEVFFWDKIRDFRRDVLDQPWSLKDREVRKCRKLQQAEGTGSEEKQGKGKSRTQAEGSGSSKRGDSERPKQPPGATRSAHSAVRPVKATGTRHDVEMENRWSKADNRGKYGALGL